MPFVLDCHDLDAVGDDPVFVEGAFQLAQDLVIAPADVPAPLAVRRAGADRTEVTLVAPDDATVLARLAADALECWRIALPGGLVARYLAPGTARTLGVRGTGPQAWACLRVLTEALPRLSRVLVSGEEAEEFAAVAARRTGLDIAAAADVELGADVLVTTTPGAITARPDALVLSTRATEPATHRTPVRWDEAVREPLTGEPVPRGNGRIILLGGDDSRWRAALDGWALRRAWELNLGRACEAG
ncbi:hypothetical protein [Actinokineospora sp.]|uniref:hypothetical protein n=1 Tax=Actinokineospora sp. TaxID=1872133 RepID=UPI004037B300